MNWDMKLQTELLKLKNPSKKDILTMVKAFEAVHSSRNRLLESSQELRTDEEFILAKAAT